MPDYFHDWELAHWMGITRDDLLEMPIHEVEEARIVMSAIRRARSEANKK